MDFPSNANLPRRLYRGDSASRLGDLFNRGWIPTKLAFGGNPFEVLRRPLLQSVVAHVDGDWELSHFLSFSANCATAKRYAAGGLNRTLFPAYDDHWDAIVFVIEMDRLRSLTQIAPGAYLGEFIGSNSRPTPLVIINASEFLSALPAAADGALAAACRDAEWLVWPLAPATGDASGEPTALLDRSVAPNPKKFSFDGSPPTAFSDPGV